MHNCFCEFSRHPHPHRSPSQQMKCKVHNDEFHSVAHAQNQNHRAHNVTGTFSQQIICCQNFKLRLIENGDKPLICV